MGKKIIASNRKARFNFELLETYEAGIVLDGGEDAKSHSETVTVAHRREAPEVLRCGEP